MGAIHCGQLREVRCVFSRRLNVSSVLDSLISVGNLFRMVEAEKLKERLLKLVVQEGIHKDSCWHALITRLTP